MAAVPKLLHLGFAWTPGAQALYPGINPAGHAFETQMIGALRQHFEIKSVGVLPLEPPAMPESDPASGLAHALTLLEKAPELLHRFRSLARLKAAYRRWRAEGWQPDVVLAYNLSPIYNQFLLWLSRQPQHPKLVLLLLDSANLGQPWPRLKRLRYRFKPMMIPDAEMIRRFDACIGLSQTAEDYFSARQIPFLWMPGGCTPARSLPKAVSERRASDGDPIRFGYFGALAPHAGVDRLVQAFLKSDLPATLEVSGYGRLGEQIAEQARQNPRLKYHGLLPTPGDCLRFGSSCDVLVNPRPDSHGNRNNFPSKLFEYALCGRAILTSRISGVDLVLGSDGFYFEAESFEAGLSEALRQVVAMPRAALQERGHSIHQRILAEYSWSRQAARMAEFIKRL